MLVWRKLSSIHKLTSRRLFSRSCPVSMKGEDKKRYIYHRLRYGTRVHDDLRAPVEYSTVGTSSAGVFSDFSRGKFVDVLNARERLAMKLLRWSNSILPLWQERYRHWSPGEGWQQPTSSTKTARTKITGNELLSGEEDHFRQFK